jgi:hypothetical protein
VSVLKYVKDKGVSVSHTLPTTESRHRDKAVVHLRLSVGMKFLSIVVFLQLWALHQSAELGDAEPVSSVADLKKFPVRI